MGYEINYGQAKDARAIKDLLDYVGQDKFNRLCVLAGKGDVNVLNFGMSFAGVSGLPFHAFARKYCLEAYRAWMNDGADPVMTDEQGFAL